ncbi:MAG: hypothetical protein CMB99_16280 [Flavobacteriaceae bacterium]|nr:hypothetical protein [Flavobacteriaceae bacterium]|tara:strand:+ start:7038 stop:7559 length:522 start_codon:yes stop_codon:yes gene_type:complete
MESKTLAQWKATFSANCKKFLAASGKTDSEARKESGLQAPAWHHYTNGARLPQNPSDLMALASAVNANPGQLFGWDVTAALPGMPDHLLHITLNQAQLTYKSGDICHIDPKIKGAIHGLFMLEAGGAQVLRQVSLNPDNTLTLSNGANETIATRDEWESFTVLGKVTAVTTYL